MKEDATLVFKSWFPLLFGIINGAIFLLSSPAHFDGLFVVNGWFVILPLCVVASILMLLFAIKWRKTATHKVLVNIGIAVLALLLLVEVPLVLIAYT